jgi:hypothetical protein
VTTPVLRSWSRPPTTDAAERYLLLADISGYTGFLSSVEVAHGVDFSGGVPAGYEVLAALLDAVVRAVQPDLEVVKLEGDAVFAIASAGRFDGHGAEMLERLRGIQQAFREAQRDATKASDHVCTACPVAGTLRLKMLLHRGFAVRVTGGAHEEIHGPAVTLVHRLLKNTVVATVGTPSYLLVTDAAAAALGIGDRGTSHGETYPDIGAVSGRVIEL